MADLISIIPPPLSVFFPKVRVSRSCGRIRHTGALPDLHSALSPIFMVLGSGVNHRLWFWCRGLYWLERSRWPLFSFRSDCQSVKDKEDYAAPSSPPMPTRSSFMSNYLQKHGTKFVSALLVLGSLN
jgi:hypothetical protein